MPATGRNFVGEWFGHRVYPSVATTPEALEDQKTGRCPFLSQAANQTRMCIKGAGSRGVCTITTTTGGVRDWLVCPYRALQSYLLEAVVTRSFAYTGTTVPIVSPVMVLADEGTRRQAFEALERGQPVVAFFQDKLGGEVGISGTESTPELSFDIVLAEICREPVGSVTVGRYAILEVQTMDFHGSYRSAVRNLGDALRLHGRNFHEAIARQPSWMAEGVEGPNIANVFKRTIYQILLKFRLAETERCAGATLTIPRAVWDSWQPHLGRPKMRNVGPGLWELLEEKESVRRCWIDVLDFDATPSATPQPLTVGATITVSAEALARCAFEDVPRFIAKNDTNGAGILASIMSRLAEMWPSVRVGPMKSR